MTFEDFSIECDKLVFINNGKIIDEIGYAYASKSHDGGYDSPSIYIDSPNFGDLLNILKAVAPTISISQYIELTELITVETTSSGDYYSSSERVSFNISVQVLYEFLNSRGLI